MEPKLLLIAAFLIVFCSIRAMECPSTCPVVTIPSGNSSCCSIGDGAAGCGVCELSTCFENKFAGCKEADGATCDLDFASCEVKTVGDISAGQHRLGVVTGDACPSVGSIIICKENAGDCVPADESQFCGHYPLTVDATTWTSASVALQAQRSHPSVEKASSITAAVKSEKFTLFAAPNAAPTLVPTVIGTFAPSGDPEDEGTCANNLAVLKWHYSAGGSAGAWSGSSLSVLGLILFGGSAMEGDLRVAAGATISVGYAVSLPLNFAAYHIVVRSTQVTFKNVLCSNGQTPLATSFTVSLDDMVYRANDANWYPSNDQTSALTFQGSVVAPDLCPGSTLRLVWGGDFTANVKSCPVLPTRQPSRAPTAPSAKPTASPSVVPSIEPTWKPSALPTVSPSASPSFAPSAVPTVTPTAVPTAVPSAKPSASPSVDPTATPSALPSFAPSVLPTVTPTAVPTAVPSAKPSAGPSANPTAVPSVVPSARPSSQPTSEPSMQPSARPTVQPSCSPSARPSGQPSTQPSGQPSSRPSAQPVAAPSAQPSGQPSAQPSGRPSAQPSGRPTGQPSSQPSGQPISAPTSQPSGVPSAQPSRQPSGLPSAQPSSGPTGQPSCQPSTQPSLRPSGQPTSRPSRQPSAQPTSRPTKQPTAAPSVQPTARPSSQPSGAPSSQPSPQPSALPTAKPTTVPSSQPSRQPSVQPSAIPTAQPSAVPSNWPSSQPSGRPSGQPSARPSVRPTAYPSSQPSSEPSGQPSAGPSSQPSSVPSSRPSAVPSAQPTQQPTNKPTAQPSSVPSNQPSAQPSCVPSGQPSLRPSAQPTSLPSAQPSAQPSGYPSAQPSSVPTGQPSEEPSTQPSTLPSSQPSSRPSTQPSSVPSAQPSSLPSAQPSSLPSAQPTARPSDQPSSRPSAVPSSQPSSQPSVQPSALPSVQPSAIPSGRPTMQPSSAPSAQPSSEPSIQPSAEPSMQPTTQPSHQPSARPSVQPSSLPTMQPSTQPSALPSSQPTSAPSTQKSNAPSSQPSGMPSSRPSAQPSAQPSVQPSTAPSSQPSAQPSEQPSSVPSTQPSSQPSAQPSSLPSSQPSSQPTVQPSIVPSAQPSVQPSTQPSSRPSSAPSAQPSAQPSMQPSAIPSTQPTAHPSGGPTAQPSSVPSTQPTGQPTVQPSSAPTIQPSGQPSAAPTSVPSAQPSSQPSVQPSTVPSTQPSRAPSTQPSTQPSSCPSTQPTVQPSAQPSSLPSTQPSDQPTGKPTSQPTSVPSAQPSTQPSGQPSGVPSVVPSAQPTSVPTAVPSSQPTSQPSAQPSGRPSSQPSSSPSGQPTTQPSLAPSAQPSGAPSAQPSSLPSAQPSTTPTVQPTSVPSAQPTLTPSAQPSSLPSAQPSSVPTVQPTVMPSVQPSSAPSAQPSTMPTAQPSSLPSIQPSAQPSALPTAQPISLPTTRPSEEPSAQPSSAPSAQPSGQPTTAPNAIPTAQPSALPSAQPSHRPSAQPSTLPSAQPSSLPTSGPSSKPTARPSGLPSIQPSSRPSAQPSDHPSAQPSSQPTGQPSRQPSSQPSEVPSGQPTVQPSTQPTVLPSSQPTVQPSTRPTSQPSLSPSVQPSVQPSSQPSASPSSLPSVQPTLTPTLVPSSQPSSQPSGQPTLAPSAQPSSQPSVQPSSKPSAAPSAQPSARPSGRPSAQPSQQPTSQPTMQPSAQPSALPTGQPTSQPSGQPSTSPSALPTGRPSSQPTSKPSSMPSLQPTVQPSTQPSGAPSHQPTGQPTSQPSGLPSGQPSAQPSVQPSGQPSKQPTSQPSSRPTGQPTTQPSHQPTVQPSGQPTEQPSAQPTSKPSSQPSGQPSDRPSSQPSDSPTGQPSRHPTAQPSRQPTGQPMGQPTRQPSSQPSAQPSQQPSSQPSEHPSSQPTAQPTGQPSRQPTSQPTRQPSSAPSTQPSAQPSRQPTEQPTSQPSGQPTVRPTGQPSAPPTAQPSRQPTSQPSAQPSRQPSGQPSGQPSVRPTTQPSRQPTSHPSGQPSTVPTAQPSRQPSAAPTTQPTRQPSGQPSSRPSARPSSSPTGVPSSQPSVQPSGRPTSMPTVPTSQPSSQPTVQPSSQPSSHPSSQPSSQPSSMPTQQPSSQPTVRPTSSRPTGVPSARPSMSPVTAHPTLPGDTTQPTSDPTMVPTVNMDYKSHFTYRDYLVTKAKYEQIENSFTFGSYYFKGLTVDGQCNSWMDYSAKQLQLPFDNVQMTSITTEIERYNFVTEVFDRTAVTCSTAKHVSAIMSSLKYGTSYVALCDDYTWRVYQCNGQNVLCVNCKMSCEKSEVCPGMGLSVGACAACQNRAAVGAVVNVKYTTTKLYPSFTQPLVVSALCGSAVVTVNIDQTGYVFCGAFRTGTVLKSVVDINQVATRDVIAAGASTYLTVPNLAPDTTYDVYCYTNDLANHHMSLADALLTKVTVSTTCPRSIVISKTFASVVQYVASSARPEPIFSFMLDSTPSAPVTVNLRAVAVDCVSGAILPNSVGQIVFPNSFTFTPTSMLLSGEFKLRASDVGCYKVTAAGIGTNAYQAASTTVSMLAAGSQPIVPTLVYAALSLLGGSVVFDFDVATDLGSKMSGATGDSFPCAQLVTFPGSAQASCKWLNATRVEADLTRSVVKANIGDIATLKANVVRAQCVPDSDCSSYTYAAMKSVTISAPVPSLKSMAVIYAPNMIWSCDDMTLDPTASYGFGVRKWNSVRWSVSALGMAQNASAVEAYLNLHYPDTTQVAVVPNRFLTRATQWTSSGYEVKLNVTNFLLKSSVVKVSVYVNSGSGSVVPQLRLFGVNKIVNRWSAVSLFAAAKYPSCASGLPVLQYRWRVYKGLTYMPSVQSVSLDPRYFKLDPYTLDTSTTYTIAVDVVVNSAIVATSSGVLQVGQSGVVASIAGGATRTTGASAVILDAFSSRDVDYPLATLTYSWSCVVYSPAFGASCAGFTAAATSAVTIQAGSMTPQVYTITVVATNAAGKSDWTSVRLTVLDENTPLVQITTQEHRFNRDSKIILNTLINAPLSAVNAVWSATSLPAFDVSSVALTTTSVILKQGQSSFQLSLTPFSLSAGRAYTFVMQAKYPASSKTATASIDVYINAPPSGGVLTVTPVAGAALSTVFLLRSSYWDDQEDDLPLTHVLAYYLLSATDLIVVKGPDQVSYVSTLLGQGLASRNYQVTCFLKVSDNMGGSTNVTAPATVTPALTSSLTVQAIGPALVRAVHLVDPTAIIQAVGAAATAVNSANCAVPTACGTLNRAPCQYTALTCGNCLSGYVGVDGDSNVACSLPSDVLPVGSACQSSASCITKSCVAGVCRNIQKSCPRNCGVGGTCKFVDSSGNFVDRCYVTDSTCKPQCQCSSTTRGSDCLKKPWEFTAMSNIRDELCSSILLTIPIQDPSAEIISSRALLVSNVLQDITQISDGALYNCTTALVQTVVAYPALSCAGEGLALVTSALSNVLQRGSSLQPELIDGVNTALVALSLGCQAITAVREVPQTIDNENIRFLSVIADRNSLSRLALQSPQSSMEAYLSNGAASMSLQSIDLSGTDTVGVSILELKNNPRGLATNSTKLSLHLTAPSLSKQTGRRLSGASSSQIGFTLVLQNHEPIHYGVVEPSTLEFRCFQDHAPRPYYLNGTCSSGLQLNFTCPAKIKGTYKVACPSYVTAPRCTSFNGADYEVDRNCTVVAYTPYNTTCYCKVAPNSGSRRSLQDATSQLLEYSTAFAVVGTSYGETFVRAPSEAEVKRSLVILSTLGGLVVMFLIGSIGFVTWDYKEQAAVATRSKKKRQKVRTVNSFFDALFPDELRDGPWYLRFWYRLLVEHPWLCLYAPYDETAASRTVKWAIAVGSLQVFLFVNSLIAIFMYADDGFCEALQEEALCQDATTTGGFFQACDWHPDNESCSFRAPELNFHTTIILAFAVSILAMPFQQFWKYCVVHAAQYMHLQLQKRRVEAAKPMLTHIRHDEFFDVQTRQATIMRAARLYKARTTMDHVTITEETNWIGGQLMDEEAFHTNNDVFGAVVTGHFHVHRTRYGSLTRDWQKVQGMVATARTEAQLIQHEVDLIHDMEERENLLMKHFIVDVFTGYKRRIVSRYFLGDKDVLNRTHYIKQQRLFCMLVLPCYAGMMLYYIFNFSASIGSRSTNMWLLVTFVSMIQLIFLIEPTKIWITWILINSQVGAEVRAFCESLSMKSRLILRRTSGLMRDSNAMVQHFNPACRVARMYPALPVARLLMSMNDRDVPALVEHSGWRQGFVVMLATLATAAAFLPEILQEAVLNVGSACFINLSLLGMGRFGHHSPIIASVTLLVIAMIIVYFLVDGTTRLGLLYRWCTIRTNTVKPVDGRTYEDFFRDKSFDENDPPHYEEKVKPVGAVAITPRFDEEGKEEDLDDVTSHPGMFHKHEKVKLKEGNWRTVKQRVTQVRGLRALSEMNRRFNIVAPVDDDVNADGFESRDENEDSIIVKSVKLTRAALRRGGNFSKVFVRPRAIRTDTKEPQRKVTFSPAGTLRNAANHVVRAFHYGTGMQRRRSMSSESPKYGNRRVAPMPIEEHPDEDPEESWQDFREGSFDETESDLPVTESSQETPRRHAHRGLVDFFHTDITNRSSFNDSSDGDSDARSSIYRVSTQSLDVV